MATGQAGSGLGIVAGPPTMAPRIDNLYALGTLLVVVQGDLPHVLVGGDLVGVEFGNGVGMTLDSIHLSTLGRVALVDPKTKVVEDVDVRVAKHLQSPADAGGAKDAQLLGVVDNNGVLAADAQLAHGGGKGLGGGQHVGVVAVLVDDLIEIEEPSLGNALLAEDLDARAAFGVIRHEPSCTEGDDAWVGADGGGGVLLEGVIELLGSDEVGGERPASEEAGEKGVWAEGGGGGDAQSRGAAGSKDGYGGHLERCCCRQSSPMEKGWAALLTKCG